MSESAPFIQALGLHKTYAVHSGLGEKAKKIRAVDGVNFGIRRGEVFALVGESGSGKSTVGKLLLRLEEVSSGRVLIDGTDLLSLGKKDLRAFRRRIQMIFQDPFASLNPHMRVNEMLHEALAIHGLFKSGNQRNERIAELLQLVGLAPEFSSRYPHEFSGGQRQRIGIARALALNPKFIVCDEPIAALDVSIQAQVVNLLEDLQDKLGLTYLFISHDLSMVRHIADRVAVMHRGRIVESAATGELLAHPQERYTRDLLAAVPQLM